MKIQKKSAEHFFFPSFFFQIFKNIILQRANFVCDFFDDHNCKKSREQPKKKFFQEKTCFPPEPHTHLNSLNSAISLHADMENPCPSIIFNAYSLFGKRPGCFGTALYTKPYVPRPISFWKIKDIDF